MPLIQREGYPLVVDTAGAKDRSLFAIMTEVLGVERERGTPITPEYLNSQYTAFLFLSQSLISSLLSRDPVQTLTAFKIALQQAFVPIDEVPFPF